MPWTTWLPAAPAGAAGINIS